MSRMKDRAIELANLEADIKAAEARCVEAMMGTEEHRRARMDYWALQGEKMRVLMSHFTPAPGQVLLHSPLGTQLACGNREVVENPTTIRIA